MAAAGIAAVVAASAEAFTAVKLAGATALIIMGGLSLAGRDARAGAHARASRRPAARAASDLGAVRDGLLTSVANPKLAVFFVALFPEFVARDAPVLPAALAMVALIVAFDLVWYSMLALVVSRAKRAFAEGPWARRIHRLTGAVLIGFGIRLAAARR